MSETLLAEAGWRYPNVVARMGAEYNAWATDFFARLENELRTLTPDKLAGVWERPEVGHRRHRRHPRSAVRAAVVIRAMRNRPGPFRGSRPFRASLLRRAFSVKAGAGNADSGEDARLDSQ